MAMPHHDSVGIQHSNFKCMCGALECCGPVACKLNMYVYVSLVIRGWYLSRMCTSNASLMM